MQLTRPQIGNTASDPPTGIPPDRATGVVWIPPCSSVLFDRASKAAGLASAEVKRLADVNAQLRRYPPYWHQANASGDRLLPDDLTLLSRDLAA